MCVRDLARQSSTRGFRMTMTFGEERWRFFGARQDYFYLANDTHCCQRERVKVNKRCFVRDHTALCPLAKSPATRIRSRDFGRSRIRPTPLNRAIPTRDSRPRDTVRCKLHDREDWHFASNARQAISSHSCCNNDASKWLAMAREACADRNYASTRKVIVNCTKSKSRLYFSRLRSEIYSTE